MSSSLIERVRARLVASECEADPKHVAAALRAEGLVLGDTDMLELVRTLRHELVGAGPLQELIDSPGVTDILVNAPAQVWVDRGSGLERSTVTFSSEAEVRRLAQRLANAAGRRLDDASPFVDARLPDGSRLHCVIPPIATASTVISLRIPRRAGFTIDDLIEHGTIDEVGAGWLRRIVEGRLSFLVSGGTGTGKTTILSALLGIVPTHERIVIVEDSTELKPIHPHVVGLQSRPPNVEGSGTVTMRDLIRQALRMRPDRIVVGEVRGAEVLDLLASMNTGHEGGCGSVHANSASDVPLRLEALGLLAGVDATAIHAMVSSGVDAIVHMTRRRDGLRHVAGINVLTRSPAGRVSTVPALTWHVDGLVPGPGLERFASGWTQRERCRGGTACQYRVVAVVSLPS